MSGLLQRLGARAIGRAWAVRSDARLPFGAERMLERPAPAAPDAAAAPQRLGTPARPHATAASPAAAPTTAAVVPAPLLPSASNALWPAPALPTPASNRATPLSAALLPTTNPATAADAPPTHAARTPAATQTPADAANQSAHTATVAPIAPGTPTPLLPATTRRNAMPAPAAHLAFGTQRAQAGTAQDTEVHIHIGRIEVTALQEASRPKAKPRERAQPMSLDTYLEQRRKVP